MSNTIAKYIIITFSMVNNPYSYHPYMFITENYSSKFTIMFFWAPALISPAKNNIPKTSLYTSLVVSKVLLEEIVIKIRFFKLSKADFLFAHSGG